MVNTFSFRQALKASILAATIVLSSVAYGQDISPYSAERAGSPQFRQCMTFQDGKTDTINCLKEEYKRQNQFLDMALKEQLQSADAASRAQIAVAQKAWLAFRDSNCKIRLMTLGSGAELFYYSCLVRETITRRTELNTVWDY